MASHIQRFLNDLGFRSESMPPLIFTKITYFLKGFDTLVVCARALGQDANLTSLLARIDQLFSRNAEIVELHGLGGFHGALPVDSILDFGAELKSFEVEIDERYTALSNSLDSLAPTLIDVIEIIDSVLEDLQNFHRLEFSDISDDSEVMEEKLHLLRNFIEFIEMLNADHQQLELQGFVIQVASVAINAAQVCARLHGLFDAWNIQGWKQVKHGWKQIQAQISALLQRIRPISVEVSQVYKTALSISKSSEELRYSLDLDPAHYSLVIVIRDFSDFLLWCLWESLEIDDFLSDFKKDRVRPLWGGLKFLRENLHRLDEEEIRNGVCDAGMVIFSLHSSEMDFSAMKEEISGGFITEGLRTLQTMLGEEPEVEREKAAEVTPQTSFLSCQEKTSDNVVGFEDEIDSLLERLTGGSGLLRVLPIVGMAGLGKTTLALQLYYHPEVVYHFRIRALFSVSQVYSRRELLLSLLNQIQHSYQNLEMTEQHLADTIRYYLRLRRYLVLLDDVWDHEVWESIYECFPDVHYGSRILITSRDRYVVQHGRALEQGPYLHRPRSDVESLKILRTKLFQEDDFPVLLHDLGMQIAESCRGLPMTIEAVAGLLTTPKPDVWKKVLQSLDSNTLFRNEQFINSFELSYRHLPDHLKLCFLSFGMFPVKQEVSAKWLYLLWIAEGIIPETQWRKIDVVAMQYMDDLVNKSLVLVTKTTSSGGVRTCRVHESIHGFCIRKAEEETHSHFLQGYDDILAVNELRGSQRLCIQSSRKDFKSLRMSRPDIHSILFLPLKDTWPRMMDDVSFIVRVFKSLRVLHIRQIDLGEVFPVQMKLLVELRYLAVQGHFLDIPSSIGNLSYLQTLIVDSHLQVALPETIWDLQKLRHLWIKNGLHFPSGNLDDSSDLLLLESCSLVIVESWDILDRLMKKFANVRKLKLKCSYLDTMSIPDSLHQLESLHVSMTAVLLHSYQFEFSVASVLRKLTLKNLELSQSGVSAVGKLPCLVSLRLLDVSFFGGEWHMDEEGKEDFQQLKYMTLGDSNIVRWTGTYHHLPRLQKLVLQGCVRLEEIPRKCLGYKLHLQAIEVCDCSPSVELQVRQIKEMKKNFGNDSIKVTINSSVE